eukprot:CAMPEP_0201928402 /NCGR_PEP_ID=MMETSP0903-20130614/20785_1 /ASSEMBLY_ACC=CAM_ASM_000552 /TAXON_ID=420261 /ORGANISM="Thalassiosira antarctica, Strain CCMP982" /LENGTH=30 /DNA_ID= /DNA_START= /DNA_END= /DNA_ORIENTATION=
MSGSDIPIDSHRELATGEERRTLEWACAAA